MRFRLVVPQSKPSAGLVIYDEAVRESAQVRVDLALSLLAERGHRGHRRSRRRRPVPGDDGRDRRAPARRDHRLDPPGHPVRLAAARPDRAHPQRLGAARGAHRDRPRARGPAVRRDARDRQQDLQRRGADRAPAERRPRSSGERRHLFIAVVPQQDGSGDAPREARARLAAMLDRLHAAGLLELRHDRRPRPLHGRDERAGAVHASTTWSSPRCPTSARAGCART